MGRPIDADALYTSYCNLYEGNVPEAELDRVAHAIASAPTITPDDLRPRGRWILGHVEPGYFTPGGNRPWICSECGYLRSWMLDEPKDNFCSNCGVKMVGESNETN